MGLFDALFKQKTNKSSSKKSTSAKSKIKCKYDLNSVKGIRSIPIPKYEPLHGMQSPTNNIEYILQRKATEHKKNGNMDLAIECLKKSNEIMPHSNFSWSAKEYLRLVEFLKQDRKFEEAEAEEKKLRKSLPLVFDKKAFALDLLKRQLKLAKYFKTDLLIMSDENLSCEICSKYQGRVFSISGKDKRFPKLPDVVLKTGRLHEGCIHSFAPFIYGVSPFEHGDPIKFSNRPFVDTRTAKEKQEYNEKHEAQLLEEQQLEKDKKEYDYIFRYYPDIAPKSFSGYRRMKNANSKGYMKIRDILSSKQI